MTQPELIRDLWREFGERIWNNDALAADIYRALCNNQWLHEDGTRFAATWRDAGEIVAGLRMRGEDGLAYYFGVGSQGQIAPAVREALARRGWRPIAPTTRDAPPTDQPSQTNKDEDRP